ncbi:hypothetical protein L596_028746 [Steinernema carpocapsae]|uniref:Uncharacterized protein n=1 Tax=Steinernema carpocapsae TaxID=34508 RepID=A0A4U5LZ89_STECR|nr:hypothetical protein L596_028746 [Steinernema carpocapsae]
MCSCRDQPLKGLFPLCSQACFKRCSTGCSVRPLTSFTNESPEAPGFSDYFDENRQLSFEPVFKIVFGEVPPHSLQLTMSGTVHWRSSAPVTSRSSRRKPRLNTFGD